MMVPVHLAVLGLLFLAGRNCVVASDNDTLVALQLLIRHGNRTALSTFDQFLPWYMKTFEPFQFGQITPNGRRQLVDTGSYIRERYNYFLPEDFSYSEVQVKCTGMDRIMESSAVVMAAMFPPKSYQKWQESGLGAIYTPIPCEYLPQSQDILLEPDSVNCTRYLNLLREVRNTPEYKKKYDELTSNGALNAYIGLALNFSEPLNQTQMGTLWDNLLGMDSFGLPLPDWSKVIYPQPLNSIAQLGFDTTWTDPECIKFGAGEFIKEILTIATLLEKDPPSPLKNKKVFAYIGHDNTIYPMLAALGFETHPPIVTYAAALIMELHRNKTTKEIGYKFLYRNQTWSDPIAYTVPGCHEICPLSFLKKKLEPFIPTKPFMEYC